MSDLVDSSKKPVCVINFVTCLTIRRIGGNSLQEIRGLRPEKTAWRNEAANEEMLRWLSSLTFHERHVSISSSRNPLTCMWILENHHFQAWQRGNQGSPKGLWCRGKSKLSFVLSLQLAHSSKWEVANLMLLLSSLTIYRTTSRLRM